MSGAFIAVYLYFCVIFFSSTFNGATYIYFFFLRPTFASHVAAARSLLLYLYTHARFVLSCDSGVRVTRGFS